MKPSERAQTISRGILGGMPTSSRGILQADDYDEDVMKFRKDF